jgi:hypothetical protein
MLANGDRALTTKPTRDDRVGFFVKRENKSSDDFLVFACFLAIDTLNDTAVLVSA